MLRLKRHNEAPSGGFSVIYKKPGRPDFKAHGWSLNSVAAQLYQEQINRGEKTSLESARSIVEQHTCSELMKSGNWEEWVEVVSEWKSEDYLPLDNYDRETTSPNPQGQLFAVVFPFCSKDGHQALKLMQWIAELTPPCQHLLITSHDYATPPQLVSDIQNAAKGTFRSIKALSYSTPSTGQWPPTMAFKAAARYMEKLGIPWLWMEPDMIPIKPEWLDTLQNIYWKCGKAFAGPIIPQMGHMNGTGIYPANTPKRIPRALDLMRTAWDITMKPEMIKDCHDLMPYLYHAWTVVNGKFHPYNGGAVPSFPKGTSLLNQIPNESVAFHRCKDLSLIERLREQKPHPQPA